MGDGVGLDGDFVFVDDDLSSFDRLETHMVLVGEDSIDLAEYHNFGSVRFD